MEYDKEILRKLQLTQVEILKDIDAFCKANDIEYFIVYGTAIGAVRHGGFIPWDDDIDIAMRREEYERFMSIAKEGMADKYDILNIEETLGYISCFAKVSKKGTRFWEATNTNEEYEQGIFVDIFPFDKAAAEKDVRSKDFRKAWVLARICMLCEIPDPIIPPNLPSVAKAIAKFGCRMVHYILRVIGLDKKRIYKMYLKEVTKYNEVEELTFRTDYSALEPEPILISEEKLLPLSMIKFEGVEFPCPRDIDAHLRGVYGDYMEIPPVEKRHNHMAKLLDFGEE